MDSIFTFKLNKLAIKLAIPLSVSLPLLTMHMLYDV